MKRFVLLTLLLGCFSFSQVSFASIWSRVDETEPCRRVVLVCLNYHFTISDWDEDDETPNPCYRDSKCTIFIGHRHYANGTSGPKYYRSWNAARHSFLVESETIGILGRKFKEILPLPFSGIANHKESKQRVDECVGIFYVAGRNLNENDEEDRSSLYSHRDLLPGSVCELAPPPTVSCNFGSETLTLDHKKLSRREVEGNEISEDIAIDCSSAIAVRVYIYPTGKLNLRSDGSIYSEIYIDDKLLTPDGFLINVNGTEKLSVKSRLHMNGKPEAGGFNGSAVMLIALE